MPSAMKPELNDSSNSPNAVFHPMPRRRAGEVVEFDEGRGLGAIRVEAGSDDEAEPEHYLFHSTRIADGTRRISVGARVEFSIIAGPEGRWEANAITAVEQA
ncbi:MAG: hypothetical protein WCG37_03935 [Actinomycetes bacterium]